jgi:hypothetical protein
MFASVVSLPHRVLTITLSAAVHLSPLRGGYSFSPLSRKPRKNESGKPAEINAAHSLILLSSKQLISV